MSYPDLCGFLPTVTLEDFVKLGTGGFYVDAIEQTFRTPVEAITTGASGRFYTSRSHWIVVSFFQLWD